MFPFGCLFFILLIFNTLKIFNLCCSVYLIPQGWWWWWWAFGWGGGGIWLFNAVLCKHLYPASPTFGAACHRNCAA